MIATSKHNKYVSIPDWFGSSSNESTTSETAAGTTTVVISGSGNTGGISGGGGGSTEIPIDNRTIVWSNSLLTVPIDDDKIIVKDGKITTSTTSGLWELREALDGSSYIYTAYPVATQQGITMYVDNNDLDLPSIYDGLPIDNVTIYWALDDNGNKVLKSIGQSGGGVADSVAWGNVIGKPSWLLDDKIQYTEIEGTPDLSGFITKAYADDNFVTFNLDEEISGIKTFTNGLKIGNSSINQSQEDVIYVDANLVVRGGVTIYADTGDIDIPSLIDSLPIAGYDTVGARGIASFDSSYFSVTNGIVTLIPDNVGLNETKLVEYLTNNNYAKKSDIPSLSGYATQSWVESKGYALNSELTALSTKVNDFLEGSDTDTIINKWLELEAFLSGLSESDNLATILGTKSDKSYVDENFVTLTTQQTISGEKNFTGGLKVNGSPIVYDTTGKYWKLEGDLLVTGGVTMYANEGTYTPSTIMDAIAVDGTTISKDGGVLKVIGSVGGATTMGSLTNVGSWADSVASQDRIMYQAANSSTWVAKNLSDLAVTGDYLPLTGGTLSGALTVSNGNQWTPIKINRAEWGESTFVVDNSGLYISHTIDSVQAYLQLHPTNGFKFNGNTILHAGNYSSYTLPLSGGTITASGVPLVINRTGYTVSAIHFQADGTNVGRIGVGTDNNPKFMKAADGTWYNIWHAGNDGSGSGLDADLLDGKHEWQFYREARGIIASADLDTYTTRRSGSYGVNYTDYYGALFVLGNANNGSTSALEIFAPSYQITISPKIRYSVDTNRYTAWRILAFEDSNVASATKLQTARTIWGRSFDGTGNIDGHLIINASTNYPIRITQSSNSAWTSAFLATNSSLTAGQHYNIDFGHSVSAYNAAWVGYYHAGVGSTSNRLSMGLNSVDDVVNILGTGNVGIGTTSPAYKLETIGLIASTTKTGGADAGLDANGTSYRLFFGVGSGDVNRGIYDRTNASWWIYRDDTTNTLIPQGNVGIGTTSPSDKLHVVGNVNIAKASTLNQASLTFTNTDSDLWQISGRFNKNFATENNRLNFYYYNGTAWQKVMELNTSNDMSVTGNILAGGGVTMYSQKSLKDIVDERGLSLEELSVIKPTRYTWKDKRDDRLHFGGIADDVQKVLPEVVYKTHDGILTMDYGNAGFAIASSLINPVISHEARIAMLEEEVKRLREENEQLKWHIA